VRAFVPVLHLLGRVITLFSFSMLVPLGFALGTQDPGVRAYSDSFFITLLCGAAIFVATRGHERELRARDGFLLVSLTWTIVPAFATLPFLLHLPRMSFAAAYFEAVSGLTTTGATVLSGLDSLPVSINAWRCFLVWIGGLGILVLAIAILPLLAVGGSQIYRAETPGPMKDTKLTPRITETARGLYGMYVGISAVCFLAMRAAGMSWFDAFCHMCSIMGLGGFSTHDRSFAYFNSPLIEFVTVVFMCIAALNFATHFLVWRRRSLRCYIRDPQTGWFFGILFAAILLIAFYLDMRGTYPDFRTAFRYALFNTVSLATTAGFSNTDYNQWPVFAPVFMLLLCCFLSCSGSTGGGIKLIRLLLLLKQAKREMLRIVHPKTVNLIRLGGEVVENRVIFSVLAFMMVYGATVIVCTMVLLFSGLDVVTAFSATIACINNTGPGLNRVGPAATYGGLTDFQTFTCVVAMLLGRLELFSLLVLFTPGFWRR